jgi:RimJ/RimL family protein N-acetyltransferase
MSIRRRLASARRMGGPAAMRKLIATLGAAIYTTQTLVVFRIRPEQLNPVAPRLDGGRRWLARSATASELLGAAATAIPAPLLSEMHAAQPGQRAHWIEVDSRIASWGLSTPWVGAWPLSETHSAIDVPEHGVCLTTFTTLPELRGRQLYPSVLTEILRERFAEGAQVAFIWCHRDNQASYRAIKRVGFEEVEIHHFRRVLGIARIDRSTEIRQIA